MEQMLYDSACVVVPHFRMSCLLIVAVLCCAFTTSLADKISCVDCGSKLATIHAVDVNPCPKMPCIFKKNTSISLTITFTPNITIDNATVEAAGSLMFDMFLTYNLDDTNACHGMPCPSKAGIPVTYKTKIPVYPKWPDLDLTVRWTIRMGSTEILCFKLPVTISA